MDTICVKNSEEWARVDDRLGGFHDGVVRRAELHSGDFVSSDLMAAVEGNLNANVLVQFQNEEAPAALLMFSGVTDLAVHGGADYSPSEATAKGDGVWAVRFLTVHVEAKACVVQLLSDAYLGPI